MIPKKKVFITGASGGIGSSICDIFLSKGYELIITSSSSAKLQLLKEKYGDNNYYFDLDLSNSKSITDCMTKISSEHKDISVINTNLNSNYYIIKSLLPNMIANRYGKIIGISSVVATTGNPGQSNYVSSKSGLIGFYKSIAHEVAKRNINVNVISPGFIETKMTDSLNEKQKDDIMKKIPMQKLGKPIDVANLVYFLSTDQSSYITGQNLNVNGGMLMF